MRNQEMEWQNISNGELLRLAGKEAFDALITMDTKMESQQSVKFLPLPVFMLSAPNQDDLEYLQNLVQSYVVPALERGAEKRFHRVGYGFQQPDYRPDGKRRRTNFPTPGNSF